MQAKRQEKIYEDQKKRAKRIEIANDRISRIEMKRKLRAKAKRRKLSLISLAAACIFFSVQVIMGYTQISALESDIANIEGQISLKEAERDGLASELEPYKDSDRIEELARLELGFDYPKDDQLAYIEVDRDKPPVQIAEEKEEGIIENILSYLRSE